MLKKEKPVLSLNKKPLQVIEADKLQQVVGGGGPGTVTIWGWAFSSQQQ
jgi:hypothetical protein